MKMINTNEQFQFTADQLHVLRSHGGTPLHVPVKEANKVYLVVEEGELPSLDEDYIRQGLAHAAEQAERGEEADWSADEIMAAGRELLAQLKHRS